MTASRRSHRLALQERGFKRSLDAQGRTAEASRAHANNADEPPSEQPPQHFQRWVVVVENSTKAFEDKKRKAMKSYGSLQHRSLNLRISKAQTKPEALQISQDEGLRYLERRH